MPLVVLHGFYLALLLYRGFEALTISNGKPYGGRKILGTALSLLLYYLNAKGCFRWTLAAGHFVYINLLYALPAILMWLDGQPYLQFLSYKSSPPHKIEVGLCFMGELFLFTSSSNFKWRQKTVICLFVVCNWRKTEKSRLLGKNPMESILAQKHLNKIYINE